MSFLYSLCLKLLYPTSVCLILLAAAVVLRQRKVLCRVCFGLACTVLLVCGNGWVVRALAGRLERQYPPFRTQPSTLSSQLSASGLSPVVRGPALADAILILSGGTLSQISPRPTIEVGEAGDRVFYGAHLYRQGAAPLIVCTGGTATGGVALRPGSEDMADLLVMLGIPQDAIVTETSSANTHQHAQNLGVLFQERGLKRILLVTSAMHMPRSLGVFRRGCPSIEFIPAPTDFRVTDRIPAPWYQELANFVPTPGNLVTFSEAAHEFLGMAYYKLRGWM